MQPRSFTPSLPFILLIAALLLFAGVQGIWITTNQTILGSDAGAHLVRSIEVLDALAQPPREAIATVWEVSEHRPPFSYIFTLPFYSLLGRTYDAALWSNTVWLLVTGAVVFAVARACGDRWDGLWSALLTLTIPLLFQLGRLYYQETLVTLLLWLCFYFLIRSNGFAEKRYSLGFGVAVGLALLVKWTLPALLAGGLLWVLWHYRREWRTHPPLEARRLGLAFIASIPLTALTVWVLALALVDSPLWLFAALWGLFYTLCLYYLTLPTMSRLSNLIVAGVTAATVASVWYFPELHFAEFFSELVFGDAGRPDEMGGFSLLSYLHPDTWLFYGRAFAFEQGGLVWAVAALVAGVVWWRVSRRPQTAVQPVATRPITNAHGIMIIGASLFGAWLIFTLSPFRDHARSMAPLLPALAILTVFGIRRGIANQRLAFALVAGLVAWQGFQFVTLTLPQGEGVAQPLQSVGLLVNGSYHYYPATGASDSAYRVAPEVLEVLRQYVDGDGRVSLAMLINETQLHQNTLRADFEMSALGMVRVVPLTRDSATPYADLFNTPFVLYKTGVSNDLSPQATDALAQMLNEPQGMFATAYSPVWTRTLPNGEEIILAQRRHALIPDSVRDTYTPVADFLQTMLVPNDVLVLDNAAQVNPLGALGVAQVRVAELPPTLAPHERFFAVLAQPNEQSEPTLNANFVRGEAWQFGEVQVIAYIANGTPSETQSDVGQLGEERLAAVGFSQRSVTGGGSLLLTLQWEAEGTPPADQLRTVVELYNAEGVLLAKRDLPPDAAFATATAVSQQIALVLPNQVGTLPACLIIARYDPASGERLRTPAGDDKLQLCL